MKLMISITYMDNESLDIIDTTIYLTYFIIDTVYTFNFEVMLILLKSFDLTFVHLTVLFF